jgi:hemoglobin-like flavoprotein
MLTERQIELVQHSFKLISPVASEISTTFYRRLFTVRPHYRAMFPADLSDQRMKLMQTLAVVVNSLNNLDGILPAVRALGKRHEGYGVKNEDYFVVGEVLIWTLETELGDVFTAETREAWGTLYSIIVDVATAPERAAA